LLLKGIGPTGSAVMAREVYYRQFSNRRQVAGFLGLATSPYNSGQMERSQVIPRAGSGPVRATMIQMAWLWIKTSTQERDCPMVCRRDVQISTVVSRKRAPAQVTVRGKYEP
jgi:transposase